MNTALKTDSVTSKKAKIPCVSPSSHPSRTANGGVPKLFAGAFVGVVSWLLLLVAAAAVLVRLDDPAAYLLPAALIVLAAASFVGGFASAKLSGFPPIICGAVNALCLLAAAALVSRAPDITSESSELMRVLTVVICVAFSLFGAMSSARKRKTAGRGKRR